jgi:hypothetical protein
MNIVYAHMHVNSKVHELSPAETSLLKSFNYLKDGRYYDKLINNISV